MTQETFLKNAEAKNYKITIEQGENSQFIGITKGRGVYHWFKCYSNFIDFHHTYSCNNGTTKKGLYHAMNLRSQLGFYN